MKFKKTCLFFVLVILFSFSLLSQSEKERGILQTMHSISSHTLLDYVKELVSEKYGGRLTGTEEYRACAEWVSSLLKKWNIEPAGENGTYLQNFPISYTIVQKGCELSLLIPYKNSTIKKNYKFEDEFIPGGTSGSGEITSEVIYVGYGVTAPELGYDDYKGVDVKGKIVLMEREVPVDPDKDPELFKKWRPYSFHQYKLENAYTHGARGMLYNYGPIANPNNSYREDFIYSHVGDAVVEDIFSGTGRNHKEVVEKIKKTLKPQSFATGKIFTIKNKTEHFERGTGFNVIGIIRGNDQKLREEAVILGAHLDHLGRCYELMPGANDNASGVAVVLGVAEALAKFPVKPKRSIVFIFFGSEEQGVVGSEFYLAHPVLPNEKIVGFINLDGVGCGGRVNVLAGENYPQFFEFIKNANQRYIHREIKASYFANIARPRLDAARFMWKGIPSLSFSVSGSPSFYHITKDSLGTITPEILEDLARLLFIAITDLSEAENLNFRN